MPQDLDLNLGTFVSRPESPSSLVRFEDSTDAHAPRLNYAVPLPGSFSGRFYMETDFGSLPWLPAASRFAPDAPDPKGVRDFDLTIERQGSGPTDLPGPVVRRAPGVGASAALRRDNGTWFVESGGHRVAWSEVRAQAQRNRALVLHRTFGGGTAHSFVGVPIDDADANPRFVVVEHYRLSSHFGDYGAGRTEKTFSLMPGEETTLYIRSWRRTEQRRKQASSIFDSFTEEAATDFSQSLEDETTDKEAYSKSRQWHVNGETHINFGVGKIGGGASVEAGGGGESQRARESMAKSVDKATQHHASKASSKRETSVTAEVETTEAAEFETIVERKVKNTNLSRTLNIVARELNQEFSSYLALVDVTVAFANDRGVFDEVRIHEIDSLLERYLPRPTGGGLAVGVDQFTRVRSGLLNEMTTVMDYQGVAKQFLEVATDFAGNRYLRVRRSSDPDVPNPHYPDGSVPVEGVVISKSTQTIRTDSVIIDSLLGHGVALDNYALGMQQESLRRQQLDNAKTELAIELIQAGDAARLEAYRSIFGSVDGELLRQVALREEP